MRYLLILFITILTIKCTQEKIHSQSINNKSILYADYSEDKLVILDLETFKEFSILNDISEQDRFLFWGKNKILRIPPQGTRAAYFEYDFSSKNWQGRSYKSTDNDVSITMEVCNYNDSLLILAGTENIYYETPYHDFYDTIKTEFGFIIQMKCSRNGILAILYSDSERVDYFAQHNLLFIDLYTKEKFSTDIKPFQLKEWSWDGNYLGLYDISDKEHINRKLEYPSLVLTDNNNFLSSYKYLNDSLLVYELNEDTSDIMGPNQLYIHNLKSNSDIRLTNKPSRKILFDIYYK